MSPAARPGTLGHQVCDGLAKLGSTLMHDPDREPLVNLIRQHARVYFRKLDRFEDPS